jgi:feruloyl esterase
MIKYKAYFLVLFLTYQFHFYALGQQLGTLTKIENFGNNPGNLKMFIHLNSKKDTNKLPLVIVLHGCGQNAQDVSDLTGWNKLADLNNFIVIYPQQKLVNNPNLCFNWFNQHDIEKNKGEGESVFQMISFAKKQYAIDSNRIYITGLSAGAAMSVVLTATHPELFKGGAIFAGGAYKIATNPIDGMRIMLGKKYVAKEKLVDLVRKQNQKFSGQYPLLIIYQGLSDPVVNYKNGTFLVNQWTGINNSDTIPDKTENSFMGIKDIKRTEYSDSLGRITVIYYEVNDLGHRLLIKPGNKENEGGATGMFGVDKGFHSTFQTAKEFGIIKK